MESHLALLLTGSARPDRATGDAWLPPFRHDPSYGSDVTSPTRTA